MPRRQMGRRPNRAPTSQRARWFDNARHQGPRPRRNKGIRRLEALFVWVIVASGLVIALFHYKDSQEDAGSAVTVFRPGGTESGIVRRPADASTGRTTGGSIEGVVSHVRDGDTIEVIGRPIRLEGVAAPDVGEPFYTEASEFMEDQVEGRHVRCDLAGETTYDREVGRCFLNGRDIGAVIIREGLARDCPRYGGGRYAGDEAGAKATGIRERYSLPGYCR